MCVICNSHEMHFIYRPVLFKLLTSDCSALIVLLSPVIVFSRILYSEDFRSDFLFPCLLPCGEDYKMVPIIHLLVLMSM